MDITNIASLDFETGSYADLRKTGAAKYAEDPTTRMILYAGYVPEAGDVYSTYTGGRFAALQDWIAEGGMVSAWNAMFEYWIWNVVLPRQFPDMTWPKLKIEQLIDTMAVAAYWGLPLSLEMAADALPHLGIQKDLDGRRLMMQMNKPRDRVNGTWWHEDDPVKLARLMDYCKQDVKTERAILEDLPGSVPGEYGSLRWGLPGAERRVWEMDAHISTRGILLDKALVERMQHIADDETARLHKRMEAVTGGEVPKTTMNAKLLDWVNTRAAKPVKSLAKDQLVKLLEDPTIQGPVREALEIRQEAAKSSVSKLIAMERFACSDGRMRGLTQYYAAFRTGRDGGRGPQVQNYPRSAVKDQEALVTYILTDGDVDGFEIFFGVTPMTALSSALRGCLTVPETKTFGAIDFSQIEARVLPWLAGAQWKLDVFASGRDVYKVAAAGIHGVPEDQVNGDQRQEGKVSELALGYAGGVGAFHSMAKVYGLNLSDERADEIKVAWRENNPEIVQLWYDLEKAAIDAIRKPGKIFWAGDHVNFQVWDDKLLMQLPSRRFLVMREPKLVGGSFGDQVSFMDLNGYTRKWERVTTYGGQLSAYATQGTARDVMKSANLRCHEAGYALLASIHDETLFELDKPEDFDAIAGVFSAVPKWAHGLPIDADGYVAKRFKKG